MSHLTFKVEFWCASGYITTVVEETSFSVIRMRYHLISSHGIVITGVIFVIILMTSAIFVAAQEEKQRQNVAEALTRKLLTNYDKLPPPNQPIVVQLGLYINYLYDINEQTMDYKLMFYLRQNWTDDRLTFNRSENADKPTMKFELENVHKLWVPDVYMSNEKESMSHVVTLQNRFVYLSDNGVIWFVTKISTTLTCPMNLQKYPFDTQECPLYFKSFGYTKDTIVYKWIPGAKGLEFDPIAAPNLPEMEIIGNTTEDCSYNDTNANIPGEYPCLVAKFTVKRVIGYFIIQYYFPSVLLVMIGWLSFWISSDAVVARVSIGLTTVLNLVMQSAMSRNQLPKVSYVKAIDVWMTTCLIFAFASLIEFATVNVWSRAQARQATATQAASPPGAQAPPDPQPPPTPSLLPTEAAARRRKDNAKTAASPSSLSLPTQPTSLLRTVSLTRLASIVPNNSALKDLTMKQNRAKALDRISRKAFPSAFIIFTIIYWLAYAL